MLQRSPHAFHKAWAVSFAHHKVLYNCCLAYLFAVRPPVYFSTLHDQKSQTSTPFTRYPILPSPTHAAEKAAFTALFFEVFIACWPDGIVASRAYDGWGYDARFKPC
jgi:hypothetical protein